MSLQATRVLSRPWLVGLREAIPLLGGYVPVAISFGLIAVQAGFTAWEAVIISTLVYAGASQFLFVGMVAAGSPLWLVVIMTLLINARHVVYAPNIAPWLTTSRAWPWLMHGLTDQVFALAHARLPQLPAAQRLGWFTGAALLAWVSWIGGTALGAVAGEELTRRWPLLGEIMPFALPALFLVLLAPRFTSRRWSLALGSSIAIALLLAVGGLTNAAIPLAAACGALCFYLVKCNATAKGGHHE
ncbi:AzlC family ABC transporter permease [Halomonas campisalis]|uniref:AzlC family ABC transporter permease n=1 Tax=Billgrantia campisalis TaxID=74661 RepID=A0ABS9PCS2_9GAMM|nr:AzlC family ABC transporter permease [Halomonas campisalis]MCG6659574.1 AzlC family ABC transporter permease [Halomonas campisalis]MDR5864534.1 AzlC family ABC transporter permease [Halomonas campisalis]